MNRLLTISPRVSEALRSRSAVVALESTLIAHGLPYPDNLAVGHAAEAEVMASGAEPATIAVLGGRVVVGLSGEELERLARSGREVPKLGAADLAIACARGGDGATTVSATAWAAAHAGIRVFATGGIGGVHRGDAADVSSDLTVMAEQPVCVVSAGAKAILDLPRTLELLETLGVLVVGYRTSELPAFYTRSSGLRLEHRAESADEVAKILSARWDGLAQRGGVLLANPIPAEHALDAGEIEAAIEHALAAAAAARIVGKAMTPFLLGELARTTGARSVRANRALVLSNCRVAGEVAASLARIAAAPPAA